MRQNRISKRLWLFRATAIAMPLLCLLVIEYGLRLFGGGYNPSFLVPAETHGELVENYQFAWRFFPRPLARTPQPIRTTEVPPAQGLRVVVLGASAAMGDPDPAYGMPRILEHLLRKRYAQPVEVINAAVTAVNSHVVTEIARDCTRLQPDAWIVYLGNNEVHGPFGAGTVFGQNNQPRWLLRSGLAFQRTRIGQWSTHWVTQAKSSPLPKEWGGLEMFLEHQVRHNDPALRRVYANFRANLQQIIHVTSRQRAPVLVSTIVTNLKDSPPFVSLHRAAMSPQQSEKWTEEFQLGVSHQTDGDHVAAEAAFAAAAQLDDGHAELAFRRGTSLLQRRECRQASEFFRKARDLDALRFRADTTINHTIRELAGAAENGYVRLVDAEEEFTHSALDGIAGNEFFHEHVHFNFHGNYLLAKLFAEELQLAIPPTTSPAENQVWATEQDCAVALGLTPFHQLLTLQEMRSRLSLPPFTLQLNAQARDVELQSQAAALTRSLSAAGRNARQQFERLLSDRPTDHVLRKQFAILLDSVGDLPGAILQYQQITAQLPHHAESQFRLGALYNRTQRYLEAEQSLRRSLDLRPDFARAANSLGICLSHQGRFAECYRQFELATQLQPSFAEAYLNWGRVLANQKDMQGAIEQYQRGVDASPTDVATRWQLAQALLTQGNTNAAFPHIVMVAELRPTDVSVQLTLGTLYQRDGRDPEKAADQFRKVLHLDPNNGTAKRALSEINAAIGPPTDHE